MKPLYSEGDIQPSYSKTYKHQNSDNEFVDDSEDDDGDVDDPLEKDDETDIDVKEEPIEQGSDLEANVDSSVKSSTFVQNGSTSSGTLGLYSSFDNIIGAYSNSAIKDDSSTLENLDISSHLKGTLSFGLPNKGNAMRISRPFKLLKKRGKTSFSHPKRSSLNKSGLLTNQLVNSNKELVKTVEKKMERDNIDHLDEDLKVAYRIVMELMGDSLKSYNSIFMETIELDPAINGDYLEVVKHPVWLPKIKEKLLKGDYKTITEVISQIRLMLENTYRYFGMTHSFSRRGLRMEYILEKKIAFLPRETRIQCTLAITNGIAEGSLEEIITRMKSASITVNGETYFSHLLYNVRGCRQAREKELRQKRMDLMRKAKQTKEIELVQWEKNLTEGPLGGPIKYMWEIVQINQFLYLSLKMLNITDVSQYEMERILMIPEASSTLRMLMTSLVLSRQQRAKLADKPYMPYSVWARRLANKTFQWYKVYQREKRDTQKVFDQLGIEPKFWLVCGQTNVFEKHLFHELTLYQRVWLLKSLCDYIAHTHKSIQETIAEQPEENMRERVLGKDKTGNEYIHFPQFIGSDVRVYRRKPIRYYGTWKQTENKPEESGGSKVFSKHQIKSFQKLIKRIKRNRERDEDWETEQRKMKCRLPKKRGRKCSSGSTTPNPPPEIRTRPERLRQTPKPRYNILACFDEIMEGVEEEWQTIQYSRKKKRDSTEEEEKEEEEEIKVEEEKKEDEGKMVEVQTEEEKQEKVEAKVTETVKGRGNRKGVRRNACKTCGKTFSSKSAMYGHMAMHVRKREKVKQSPVDENESEPSTIIKYEKDEKKTTINNGKINEEIKTRDIKDEPTEPKDDPDRKSVRIKELREEPEESKAHPEQRKPVIIPVKLHGGLKPDVVGDVQSEDDHKTDNSNTLTMSELNGFSDLNSKALKTKPDKTIFRAKKSFKIEKNYKKAEDGEKNYKEGEDGEKDTKTIPRGDRKDINENTECKSERQNNGKEEKVNGVENITANGEGKTDDCKDKLSNIKIEDNKIVVSPYPSSKNVNEHPTKSQSKKLKDSENDQLDFEQNQNTSKDDSIMQPNRNKSTTLDNSCSDSPSDDSGKNTPGTETPPVGPVLKSGPDESVTDFELVASSFVELRNLIVQFGTVPLKYAKEKKAFEEDEEKREEQGEQDATEEENENIENIQEKEDEKETSTDSSVPKCEQKLHRSLCKLLMQLAPFEAKINTLQRQLRKKLWNEYLEWSKRDLTSIDPAEDAWNSDPEPDPVPSATQTPKQSSSSSSSEESFNEDGSRKRKLRKRRVKRILQDPPSPSSSMPDLSIPSPPSVPSDDKLTVVSSRGRVRKVKRIINYDRLDFDKLAQQAEKDATAEKDRKKKKKEEENLKDENREKALQEAAQSLHIPASGVRRYIISKGGAVVGYISNDGQVHSGMKKVEAQEEDPLAATSAETPTTITTTTAQSGTLYNKNPFKELPKAVSLKKQVDKTPKVVVSAMNENGTPVYVRMVGSQALELIKLIEASRNDPPRQVKLQRLSQTYTFHTNSYVMTQNIPGYPDSDTSNPQFLSNPPPQRKLTSPVKAVESKVQSIASPAPYQLLNPVSTMLTYQQPLSVVSNQDSTIKSPQNTTSCASLSSSTRLVFASPSAVPSVTPMTSSNVRVPVADHTSIRSPVLVQSENGQQVQIGINSEKLSQIIQKTGQRVVAIPNDKGGYTISLINTVAAQPGTPKVTQGVGTPGQPLRTGQKSVITQLLPTVVNASGAVQPMGMIKNGTPTQSPSVVHSQQQFPSQYTVNTPVNASSNLGRQFIIQHSIPGSTPVGVVASIPQQMTQSQTKPQQLVHVSQNPVLQQQQIIHFQQPGGHKVLQVVQTSSGRQLVQMLQPGQILVTGTTVPTSSAAIQPTSGVVVHPQKQQTILQPQQVVIQQPQHQTKVIQVADQFVQPQQHVQYQQDEIHPQQQVIIQPQHYVIQQDGAQNIITKPQHGLPQQLHPEIQPKQQAFQEQAHILKHSENVQPLITHSPNNVQQTHLPQSKETSQPQQTTPPIKDAGGKQAGRLTLLQTNDSQKYYLHLPDGRLAMLTPEQLQPLIGSGVIKLNS